MDKKRIQQDKKDVVISVSSSSKQSDLKKLVDRFTGNIKQYEDNNYKEFRVRADFIDPFFELLDWDLGNKQGFSEAYRDVIREDQVMVGGQQKAPDYCFKIGVEKKFFVEAKKPSVDIKKDIGAAYQLRRYAYSAKLPLSILTDFHEFAVYDTRIKPKPKDKAEVARIFYCKFDEYEQNFEYIYNTFSKDAILKGSFDRYVADTKKKKGTSEVDKEFLKLIEDWRNDLAKNIAVNNLKLDLYSLNTAVQKIIDRIIFLRIAEARNIEPEDTLSNFADSSNIYKKLDVYFQQADKRYNSGLFKIENWLSDLKIDDKVLKDLIKSTYYPESPYEFSVLPVEILGNIYEQFLGKVIHLTATHQAKIEEKPEVKKAGGVYYTPQYIVDYIVKNTVGEKVKDSTPEKIEALKTLDPACGSGSFLLGAYAYLLRWHLDYYTRDKKSLEKYKKLGRIYDYKGDFKLTIDEKKKILKNNIFGVDIDGQAVEVTKLSLLLKLMEDETQQSAGMLIKYSKEALLPDLSDNIKCGNSLIGTDFYGSKNMSLFGNDEMRKVNAFDWEKEFKDIFGNGGFDVVIGNPPYVVVKGGRYTNFEENAETIKYYKNNYKYGEQQINLFVL
ncbi:MAG: N-6 DNA methylase, partial [Candidatus Parcubacteria bacterium]|nr:N-6 DNA methylase [Candidatus Parcubacteria bacterium]